MKEKNNMKNINFVFTIIALSLVVLSAAIADEGTGMVELLYVQNTQDVSVEKDKITAVIAGDRRSVAVVEIGSGVTNFEIVHDTFPGQRSIIWSAAVSPDGQYVATGGRDTTARLWDGTTGGLLKVFTAQFGDTSNHEHEGGYIWSVTFSPDSRFLVTAGYFGHIRLWDVPSGKKRFEVGKFGSTQNPPGVVVEFSEDGRSIMAEEQHAGTKVFSLPERYWP